MERRYSLDFFLDSDYSSNTETDVNYFYIEKGDVFFAGRELLLEDRKITYYIYPLNNNSAFIMLYLGDDYFDNFIENLTDDCLEAYSNTWPKLMTALNNGVNDNYSHAGLMKFITDEFKFWSVCTKVENINFEDLETEYIMDKLGDLYIYTVDMLNEIIENDINFWEKTKSVAKSGYSGYRKGKLITNALGIAGTLFGIPGLEDIFSGD